MGAMAPEARPGPCAPATANSASASCSSQGFDAHSAGETTTSSSGGQDLNLRPPSYETYVARLANTEFGAVASSRVT